MLKIVIRCTSDLLIENIFMSNMLHWIYSVVLQIIVRPIDFQISLVFLYNIDQNLNKWIIAEILKYTQYAINGHGTN